MSEDMVVEGFDVVSTEFENNNGEKIYPLLLITRDSYDSENEDYSKSVGSEKVITITKELTNEQFDFQLLNQGTYVFEIRNYQNLRAFTVETDTSIECFQITNSSTDPSIASFDLSDKGVYQFKFEVPQSQHFTLTLTIEKEQVDDHIKINIYPIQQINTSKGIYNFDNYNSIMNSINNLSRGLFNYLYVPNDNKLIENPLKADSFNNINHFYNQFTICKVVEYDILGDDNIYVNN